MTKSNERGNPQSCWNKANEHEIMFILLDRDTSAPATIRFWCKERISQGLNSSYDSQIDSAMAIADRIERLQANRQVEESK